MTDYMDACFQAAEFQGLNPIIDVLTTAGIANELWQSGGFCMIVTVPAANNTQIWVTSGEHSYGTEPGIAMFSAGHICHQGDEQYDNCLACQTDTDGVKLEDLVETLRRYGA